METTNTENSQAGSDCQQHLVSCFHLFGFDEVSLSMKNLMEIERDIKQLLPSLSKDELNEILAYVRTVRNESFVS